MLSSNSNTWQQVKSKMILNENDVVSTDKSSSVLIKSNEISFTLKESSAITVSNIKKMTLDELIFALAMENVMNTPRIKENVKSDNTGVYGDKVTGETLTTLKSNDFGIKRLNGAKQLAENGMKNQLLLLLKKCIGNILKQKKMQLPEFILLIFYLSEDFMKNRMMSTLRLNYLNLIVNRKYHVNGNSNK